MSAMKLVVIGGTGRIGARTVDLLRQRGHEVVAAAPALGVNTITGEGLHRAIAQAQVVIDVSDSPSFEPEAAMRFFDTSGRALFSAEGDAPVRHHVALSVVGVDQVPGQAYYRAKLAQEKMIMASGMPYTIIRSTQFFEFLRIIADAHIKDDVVRIARGLFQPVAADDVAAMVAAVAVAAPGNGIIEIAGPQRAPFFEVIARYLQAIGDPRRVVEDPQARYFGGSLSDTSLVPSTPARLGRLTLDAWLSRCRVP